MVQPFMDLNKPTYRKAICIMAVRIKRKRVVKVKVYTRKHI